jgi:hypothetical protein
MHERFFVDFFGGFLGMFGGRIFGHEIESTIGPVSSTIGPVSSTIGPVS